MAATMKMMDGEKKSGEALRASYKVNCEKYLADHHYSIINYCAAQTTQFSCWKLNQKIEINFDVYFI